MTTLEPRINFRPGRALRALDSQGAPATEAAGRGPLTRAVRSVVRLVQESLLRPVARRDAGLAYEPRTLLALLSYCYARDIFGSEEIEDVLRRDGHFRSLCNNEFPDARMIRHFRRDNREVLQRCLSETLLALAKDEPRTVTDQDPATAAAEDASRRIMKAMFIDSMETD